MKTATILLTLALMLAACAPTAAQPALTPSRGEAIQIDAEAQELVCRARADLAQNLGLDASEIQLDSISWPAESGGHYVIRFEINGQTYEYNGRRGELASNAVPCES